MSFRDRLVATLRAIEPVLLEPGVLVVGSEVPNLLEPGAASTLVVSQDVDIGVPVTAHAAVKERLRSVEALRPSPEEPSVWIPPQGSTLLEVNFVGMDAALADPGAAYVLEDHELPLLVFGALSLVEPADPIDVDGIRVPVPRKAGLVLEKLLTDRTAEKGERDRLVALGLLLIGDERDLTELEARYAALAAADRHTVRSNLAILSLTHRRLGMPDPEPQRERVATLLRRFEEVEVP